MRLHVQSLKKFQIRSQQHSFGDLRDGLRRSIHVAALATGFFLLAQPVHVIAADEDAAVASAVEESSWFDEAMALLGLAESPESEASSALMGKDDRTGNDTDPGG